MSYLTQIMDQESKLNLDLLKSGKFKDAVDSLLTWMTEAEEMLANQKTTSLDDKVIRSQLQTQRVGAIEYGFIVTQICFRLKC